MVIDKLNRVGQQIPVHHIYYTRKHSPKNIH